MDDEFASFRAAHPSVRAALDACTRPDWLVLLAQEALGTRNAVRIGHGAATLLDRTNDTLWLFKPNPGRLETIEVWSANSDDDAYGITRSGNFARAVALAGVPAVVLAYLIEIVALPGAWTPSRELGYIGIILALEILFTVVFHTALAAVIRRRAAALDEHSALALVLDAIRKDSAASPQLLPLVMRSSGNRLRRALDALDAGGPK